MTTFNLFLAVLLDMPFNYAFWGGAILSIIVTSIGLWAVNRGWTEKVIEYEKAMNQQETLTAELAKMTRALKGMTQELEKNTKELEEKNEELETLNKLLEKQKLVLEETSQELEDQNAFLRNQRTNLKYLAKVICHDVKSFVEILSNEYRSYQTGKELCSINMFRRSECSLIAMDLILNNVGQSIKALSDEEDSFVYQTLSLSEILKEIETCVEGFRLILGATIDIQIPEGLLIEGDRIRLTSIFRNLIINALRSIKRKVESDETEENYVGKIEIVAQREKDILIIYVEDNGEGISSTIAQKLFNANDDEVLGLGTKLVKRFVNMHRGSVEVYENWEDEGCVIRLKFPVIKC